MAVQRTTVIVDAASSYDLVALTDLKADLSITDDSQDPFLTRAISKASAAIGQYCNRVFAVETVADTFDLSFARLQWGGEAVLQTSRWPIAAITSLTENGVALVQDTDFRVDAASGLVWRLNADTGMTSSWRVSPVVFTYDGGFGTIPLDLQGAVTSMVQALQFSRTRDPQVRQVSVPGVVEKQYWVATGSEAGSFTAAVTDILDNYRVPTVA